MSQIKVSIFVKIIVFAINLIFIIGLFIVPKNIISLNNLYSVLIVLPFFVSFYYVLKNNTLAIKIFGVIIFLYLLGFNQIKLIISKLFPGFIDSDIEINYYSLLINIILILFILYKLYYLNKNIKKGIENIEEKKLTNKDQTKTYLYMNLTLVIFILIFRFGYYTADKGIEKIDDSFFVTKYENIDIKDEDNLYIDIKNIEYKESHYKYLKEAMVSCLYEDKCYSIKTYEDLIKRISDYENDIINKSSQNLYPKINSNEKDNFETEKKRINITKEFLKQNIDLLYKFSDNFDELLENQINKLQNKEYYKVIDSDETIIFSSVLMFNRELKYKILYYLNNNEEDKAIEIIISQIKTYETMLNGDSTLIHKLAAMAVLHISYENIDLIIKKYDLKIESKESMIKSLENKIDLSPLDNGLIQNYKNMNIQVKEIAQIFSETTFFDYEEAKNIEKEKTYYLIKNKGIIEERFKKDITFSTFLKSNQIAIILSQGATAVFSFQYKKLEDLIELRNLVIENLKN